MLFSRSTTNLVNLEHTSKRIFNNLLIILHDQTRSDKSCSVADPGSEWIRIDLALLDPDPGTEKLNKINGISSLSKWLLYLRSYIL
jgi:hypothetical protein